MYIETVLMDAEKRKWDKELDQQSKLRTYKLQLTLVISTSLISNNRLSRTENLVPALTWKSNNR